MDDEMLAELFQTIGRIEGTMEGFSEKQKEVHGYVMKTSDRVGKIEQRLSGYLVYVMGASAVIALVVSAVVALVK